MNIFCEQVSGAQVNGVLYSSGKNQGVSIVLVLSLGPRDLLRSFLSTAKTSRSCLGKIQKPWDEMHINCMEEICL